MDHDAKNDDVTENLKKNALKCVHTTNLRREIQVDGDLKNQDDPEQSRAEKIKKWRCICICGSFCREYNSLL